MTKGKILQSIWDNLPDDRKKHIQARTKELEMEYLTLQELRKAAGLTQPEIERNLDMPQVDERKYKYRDKNIISHD